MNLFNIMDTTISYKLKNISKSVNEDNGVITVSVIYDIFQNIDNKEYILKNYKIDLYDQPNLVDFDINDKTKYREVIRPILMQEIAKNQLNIMRLFQEQVDNKE